MTTIIDPVTKAEVPIHYLDGVIRRMFWRFYDTQQIAEMLKVEESFVANRLAFIRDQKRAA